ncbi:protein of unknown function [Noviherbaspirillum humi]|uniref:DUF4153 domain-containing protein n=2 Tax=Noviherbaspirillum humi TaxID=1688639 RepID=A0A239ISA8_9BURK|nr:protein of unknown function [Noviherbaspirillum humi]
MPTLAADQEAPLPESAVTAREGWLRLLTGGLQGLLLYVLYFSATSDWWSPANQILFAPLLLVSLFAPILLIVSLGHLRRRPASIWLAIAAVIIASLGVYDIWRGDTAASTLSSRGNVSFPSTLLVFFLAIGFFIAHSLLLSGVQDKRHIARYATHFENAWKLIIQLGFSYAFVGVLWGALFLGALLFSLIKLDFLRDLLEKSWFAIPVTTLGFSCALHITDVRPAIVQGIRSLLLVLLSWILPVATLIVLGFLVSLPVAGLQPLWETKSATAILLGAAAMLVVLINAAFQNGEVSSAISRIVRISARLAALALLPVVALAIYALYLRVHEHGWTTDRIIAASFLLVATCYALGYAISVFHPVWMRSVARTNMATAYLILVELLALFSPLFDPARISVNSQLARLRGGRIAAAEFDYEYLRFQGARYGREALEQLLQAQGTDAETIRRKAQAALMKKNRWDKQEGASVSSDQLSRNITVWPKNERLPFAYTSQQWAASDQAWQLPTCLRSPQSKCDAFMLDITGDGKNDILLLPAEKHVSGAIFVEGADHSWWLFGTLPLALTGCDSFREKLIAGDYRLEPVRTRQLRVGNQSIEVHKQYRSSNVTCPSE